MNAVIKIKTTRIFFEQFQTPCGEPEDAEVRQSWEAAIYAVIEKAGFTAETEIGVGYDPRVIKFVTISADDECDCDNASPDCDCSAKEELPDLIKLCEKYGELIAENADDAGFEAARTKCAEFIEASVKFLEEQKNEQDS